MTAKTKLWLAETDSSSDDFFCNGRAGIEIQRWKPSRLCCNCAMEHFKDHVEGCWMTNVVMGVLVMSSKTCRFQGMLLKFWCLWSIVVFVVLLRTQWIWWLEVLILCFDKVLRCIESLRQFNATMECTWTQSRQISKNSCRMGTCFSLLRPALALYTSWHHLFSNIPSGKMPTLAQVNANLYK